MATDRQIQANRQRAELSTGPRTDEGKAASRGNACRHGLSGAGVALPPDETEEVRRRAESWAAVLQPADAIEAYHVAQYALETVRIERCQAHERLLLHTAAVRAASPLSWEEDRRFAAEEVGSTLARDPARAVRRLRQSSQGCDWLIRRWEGLARVLERGRPWDDAQRRLALDLLGLPAALRGGPTPADRGDGPDPRVPQAALAAGQVAELSRLRDEVLNQRDAEDREAAALGHGDGHGEGMLSRALRLVRRYEAASQRRLEKSLRLILSGRELRKTTPAVAAPAEPPPAAVEPVPVERVAPAKAVVPGPCLADAVTATVPAAPAPTAAGPVEPTPTGAATPAGGRPRGNRRWRKEQFRRARGNAA